MARRPTTPLTSGMYFSTISASARLPGRICPLALALAPGRRFVTNRTLRFDFREREECRTVSLFFRIMFLKLEAELQLVNRFGHRLVFKAFSNLVFEDPSSCPKAVLYGYSAFPRGTKGFSRWSATLSERGAARCSARHFPRGKTAEGRLRGNFRRIWK